MIVMKFGGTSFTDSETWSQVLSIVRSRIDKQPIIVASAVRGTTDDLAFCAEQAAQGRVQEMQSRFERIASTHFEAADRLNLGKPIREHLGLELRELKKRFESVVHLEELSLRTRDQILSYGELFTSRLLTAALQRQGVDATHVDSREIVVTDDDFSAAHPMMKRSGIFTRRKLIPLLRGNRIPVVPGFIGATRKGETTTLGRGASDYSAALFARWLQADELEIWKDVPGFMTADPRVVPDAKTIPFLNYQQAEQLCKFGAKILHPLAVRNAARQKIPVRILFTKDPNFSGSLISTSGMLSSAGVVGITSHKDSGRVIVIGEGLQKPSVAAQILQSCGGLRILRVSQNSSLARMILVTAKEDTEEAIRQIHSSLDGTLALSSQV
jgi:aspartate kinase